MIRPKLKLVRIEDTPFSESRLISEMATKVRVGLGREGRISDTNLGFGFNVQMGRPSTIRDYLFPSSYLTSQNSEHVRQIKNVIDGGKL